MKISKSKQELARIISENGGWLDGGFAAQDGDGGVGGYEVKPEWNSLSKYWWREASGEWFRANKIKNHHQTVLSRAEYFHLYPAPDADGWIEWKGGSIDIDDLQLVDYKMRCTPQGSHLTTASMNLVWDKTGEPFDIIAYRMHNPEQSKPEFCESVMRSIPEPDEQVWTNPPTIDHLAADYRNAMDYADRKQQEADDARADADERLKALEIAGEALYLIVTPIAAKQEPDLVITDWRDLIDGDVIRVDSVEASEDIRDALQGVESVVVTDLHMTGCVTNENYPGGESWWLGGPAETKWRFIRRP